MSYAEIHFHLLPAIDDGPSSIEESVALAAAAAAEGTRTIVATPHVHPSFDTDVSTLPDRVDEVRAHLAAERIPIQVRCGAELAHDMVGRMALGRSGAWWRAIEHELAAGSALQINAWSVAGLYGDRTGRAALTLLRCAAHAVVASDAHGGARTPALGLAMNALATAGLEDPRRFVDAGPWALLERGLAVRPDSLAA